jgi:S-adenosylmethionine:tRNA ribosyltransferase-isomerase
MDLRDFDFDLPSELIAQEPLTERSGSRLLSLNRATGAIIHTSTAALPEFLEPGDVLVINNTRVFPARLIGRRVPSGGAVECLLIGPVRHVENVEHAQPDEPDHWEALVHPGQKLKPGAHVVFDGTHTLHGEILERRFHGRRVIRLWTEGPLSVDEVVDAIGHVPLPPYIKRGDHETDRERYQTIFARSRGSVAAPTAGLHFSQALVDACAARGVEIAEVTLHVGYGTFQPVRVERVEDHRVEAERYEISRPAAETIANALRERRRIIAVGTTTTRALEGVARQHDGRIVSGTGWTDVVIYPGFAFRVISGLLTNFHLPRSSLLMLVSAFAGRERVLDAYRQAIAWRYRFYSYGDAMLIL